MDFFITVFTPAYNRGHLLDRVFQSLERQKGVEFEWIIVDDGSLDNTKTLVDVFRGRASFEVIYIWQENGGKHRAINRGVDAARGELFLVLDSDDYLVDGSLARIKQKWDSVRMDSKCMGISGNRIYHDGQVVGSKIPNGKLFCNFLDFRYKYHLDGDRGEAFRLDVFKEFPFPDFENEKFCPESLIWNRMAKKYAILYVDDDYVYCEYLESGLSSNSLRLRRESPTYATLIYDELLDVQLPLTYWIRAGVNYWRFSSVSWRIFKINFLNNVFKPSRLFFLPLGLLAALKDRLLRR